MRRLEALKQRDDKTCLSSSFKVIQHKDRTASQQQMYAFWFDMTFSQHGKQHGMYMGWDPADEEDRSACFQSYQIFEMNVERDGFFAIASVLKPWLEAFYLVQDCVNAFNSVYRERPLEFSYSYNFSDLEGSAPVRIESVAQVSENQESFLSVFCHFSWLISAGRFLIEFKRKTTDDCSVTMFVHCNDDHLCPGPMNEGMAGIRHFFRRHRCSSDCKIVSERMRTTGHDLLRRNHIELKHTARYQAEDLAKRLTHGARGEFHVDKQQRRDTGDRVDRNEPHRCRRPRSISPVRSSRRLSPSISD
eukprot:764060-Hanusia_phi.AAC.3